MDWFKRHRGTIVAILAVVFILSASYFSEPDISEIKNTGNGTDAEVTITKPDTQMKSVKKSEKERLNENKNALSVPKENSDTKTESEKKPVEPTNAGKVSQEKALVQNKATNSEELKKAEETTKTEEDTELLAEQPEGKTVIDGNDVKKPMSLFLKNETVETASETVEADDKKFVCTLFVRCDTINQNFDKLDETKKHLVPADGIIFSQDNIVFYENESVFDVLLREMKNSNIHFEYVDTPMYDSVYIEGINNIYEFDCGSLSGWLYSVNGQFPGCGCSQYKVKSGDVIEVMYTCDMGKDVGKN